MEREREIYLQKHSCVQMYANICIDISNSKGGKSLCRFLHFLFSKYQRCKLQSNCYSTNVQQMPTKHTMRIIVARARRLRHNIIARHARHCLQQFEQTFSQNDYRCIHTYYNIYINRYKFLQMFLPLLACACSVSSEPSWLAAKETVALAPRPREVYMRPLDFSQKSRKFATAAESQGSSS